MLRHRIIDQSKVSIAPRGAGRSWAGPHCRLVTDRRVAGEVPLRRLERSDGRSQSSDWPELQTERADWARALSGTEGAGLWSGRPTAV